MLNKQEEERKTEGHTEEDQYRNGGETERDGETERHSKAGRDTEK